MERPLVLIVVALGASCSFHISGVPIASSSLADLAATPLDDLAGVDLNVVACPFVLCEDFESGAIASRWTVMQSGGSVIVDTTRAHSGSFALHVHSNPATPNNTIDARISEQQTFPQLMNGLFVRAWVYWPGGLPASTLSMYQLQEMLSPYVGDQLDYQNGGGLMGFVQYNSNPDVFRTSATTLPANRWVCVEWQMLSGESRTFIDDTELADIHMTGLKLISFGAFWIGAYFYKTANQPAYDLWIDDLALGDARIGCN